MAVNRNQSRPFGKPDHSCNVCVNCEPPPADGLPSWCMVVGHTIQSPTHDCGEQGTIYLQSQGTLSTKL